MDRPPDAGDRPPDAGDRPPSQSGAHLMMTDQLLTRQQVEKISGLSRSSLYRMMRTQPPEFPTPIKISRRSVRWRLSEVSAWLDSRPRATGNIPR